LNGVATAGLTGFGAHCGNNGVADDDGDGLKKPLAVGTSSDETEAPQPLAVVATAGLPLGLLDLLMILD
jgi:hypothetical protein